MSSELWVMSNSIMNKIIKKHPGPLTNWPGASLSHQWASPLQQDLGKIPPRDLPSYARARSASGIKTDKTECELFVVSLWNLSAVRRCQVCVRDFAENRYLPGVQNDAGLAGWLLRCQSSQPCLLCECQAAIRTHGSLHCLQINY